MSRPIYETEQTLSDERKTIDACCSAWGGEPHKLSMKYQIDWAVVSDGRVIAWVECKRRRVKHNAYPTLILSLHKWETGVIRSMITGTPFIVVVEYDDRIMWFDSSLVKPDVVIGGRRDRGDSQDIEPLVDIPITLFQSIT